jgi:hypothetical protein
MCSVDKSEIQEHVRVRLEAEREDKERRRREKQEAHLYTFIRLVTDQDLLEQIGSDRWFDLADADRVGPASRSTLRRMLLWTLHMSESTADEMLAALVKAGRGSGVRGGADRVEQVQVKQVRVKKQSLFRDFREQAAQELGLPVDQLRFWTFAKRLNNTLRWVSPSRVSHSFARTAAPSQSQDGAVLRQALEDHNGGGGCGARDGHQRPASGRACEQGAGCTARGCVCGDSCAASDRAAARQQAAHPVIP